MRLTGLGRLAQRLDLSLIDEQPDQELFGVRIAELASLKGTDAYLVLHPVFLQLWIRSGPLSWRQDVRFEREKLLNTTFFEHDPDGIGASDNLYRSSVGTLSVSLTDHHNLYILLRINP
ncbi:hypothetical protein ACQP1G_20555 [Nocardia sp. CA-107356]|uniref:hypothetical protein n=1 Tax=Nocardia sp. CA-107356 TaxID=3239972 RepID=UPI003D8AB236